MSDSLTATTKEPQAENTASDIVHANQTQYLSEVIKMQFPTPIDGLKKVQLRFLWAGRKGDFNDEIKSGKVVGTVLDLHHHGDSSIYDAIMRMAQAWNVNPPIVHGIGNIGSYSGGEPARMRYTSMELTAFARDVFYGGIEMSVLPMAPGANGDLEPSYFIPTIPTALLYGNLTVGYGYQSNTVSLNLGNVCDLVSAYGLHQSKTPHKSFDYSKYADKFIPDFPNPCILTNTDELLSAYRRGEFETKITLDGQVILAHDRIVLITLPEIDRYIKAKSTIEEAIQNKSGPYDGWIGALYPEKNTPITQGGLLIELKRGVNVFDVWDDLKRLLRFSNTMKPNPNYCTSDGRLIQLSLYLLLRIWYEKRHAAIMSSKRKRLESMQKNLRILEARLIVYAYIDEVVALIRGSETRGHAVIALQKRFDISTFQASALAQIELGDLTRTSKQELLLRRERQAADIAKLNQSFGRIGEEIANEAQRIKKTYPMPLKTRTPIYVGCVSVAGGVIQIESPDEVAEIVNRFPKGELRVSMYDGPHILHVDTEGKPSRRTASKYTRGEIYGLLFNNNHGYTVTLRDGAACCVSGVVPGPRSEGYFYTTKLAKVLTRRGEVRTIDVTEDLSVRKSIGRGAATDIIYLYPNTTEPHYLAVLNTHEQNIIHIQRIEGDAARATLNPVGELVISHSLTGLNWFLPVDERYLNRINARVFRVKDAAALLGKDRQIRLDLASAKIKRSPFFEMLA